MSETSPPPSVQIRLHGPAQLHRTGASPVALDSKQAAVIAWLAVHGPTPRARLAALLWPDASAERARGNLRQRLSTLRQGGGDVVGDEHGLLALGAGAVVDPPPVGAQWLEAFEYDDCADFSAWLEAMRDSQRGSRRQALLAAVRASVQSGALDRALEQADELLGVDRESEEAYRALMEVFYLRGDRAAAIAVWDRCREMLRSLYGVLPSAATQRLGQSILASAGSTEAPMPGVAIPVTVLRPPRLVGRAGVVDALVAAWRIGDAVCVSGEGGVGKSRVLAELAAAIGACAIAAARPDDALSPYASLSRLVLAAIARFRPPLDGEAAQLSARLLPRIATTCGLAEPEPLRTAHERAEALRGLTLLLGACVEQGCAAFVFDDLQFADFASIEAMQALADDSGAADRVFPSRFAFGSRSEELTSHGAALLASLASARRLWRVELEPLGETEVLELMQCLELPGFAADRFAPRLRRQVGGNPAFLLESVKLIAALGKLDSTDQALPVPPGIEAVVERRLALLSPAARHIAELAAIAGEKYDASLAARALARPLAELGEPLRELEGRQVLYGRQFVHDIVAAAVRRAIPAAVAEFLHRFVATELEAAGGEPAVIGAHWRDCAEWRRAGDSFRAAASKARDAARPAELAQMLDAAAECYAKCDAAFERFVVLRERMLVTAAPDYTRTCAAQLQTLVAAATDEEQRLQAMVATVMLHADHARSDTIAMGEDGLRRARALGLDQLAFEFAHALAWQYAGKGEPQRGLEVLDACRDWILGQDDLSLRSRFHTALAGTHALSDHVTEAIADSERAIETLRAADDPVEMLSALANVGLLRTWRGEFAAARDVLLEAQALRHRLHGHGSSMLIDIHLGSAFRDLGDYARALGLLEPALAEYQAQAVGDAGLRTDVVICENHLAQLWLALGQPARAEQHLESNVESTELRFQARRAVLRLRAARARGPTDAVRLEAARRLTADLPPTFGRFMAELELLRGETPEAAVAPLTALCDAPPMRERPGLRMNALAQLATVWRRLGRRAEARACVDELLRLDESFMPFDMEPPDVWSAAHAVLNDAGETVAAARVAAKAERWLRATAAGGVPAEARESFARRHREARRAMGIAEP